MPDYEGKLCLFLIDGPFKSLPSIPANTYFVIFMSGTKWLSSGQAADGSLIYYMPMWSEEELLAANFHLSQNKHNQKSDEKVHDIFDILGGYALYCLNPTVTNAKLENRQKKIQATLDNITVANLEGHDSPVQLTFEFPSNMKLTFPLKRIRKKYISQMKMQSMQERYNIFMQWLKILK